MGNLHLRETTMKAPQDEPTNPGGSKSTGEKIELIHGIVTEIRNIMKQILEELKHERASRP